MKITCNYENATSRPVFSGVAVAISFLDTLKYLQNPEDRFISDFYDTYMASHPLVLLESGSRNLMLMRKKIVQNVGEEISVLNTFLESRLSRAPSPSKNYTGKFPNFSLCVLRNKLFLNFCGLTIV